jgi:hypothetical protein
MVMNSTDASREGVITAELSSVAEMLASDGYLLEVETATDAEIMIRIRAGADACAECLVGPELLQSFITAELAKSGTFVAIPAIHLVMPDPSTND